MVDPIGRIPQPDESFQRPLIGSDQLIPTNEFAGYCPTHRRLLLRKNKNQIQVYARRRAGSPSVDLKAVCTRPGTMSQLVALLSDVENYKPVIYKTKTAYLLQRTNETRFTYYVVNELPVVHDRDMTVQLTFS